MVDSDLKRYNKKIVVMNSIEKKFLKKLIIKNKNEFYSDREYPLIDNPFETSDLMSGINVLLKGKKCQKLQIILRKNLQNMLVQNMLLMVNSGSSIFLSFFALINPKNKKNLKMMMNV